MDAVGILCEAGVRGITLRLIDGNVRCRPKDRMDDEFRVALARNKQEIMKLLSEQKVRERETQELLSWAARLVKQHRILGEPLEFVEKLKTRITKKDVSEYAKDRLMTISYCRSSQYSGGMGRWSVEWFRDMELDAVLALANLKKALEAVDEQK